MNRYQQGKKISIISIILNIVLAILKIMIGLLANSSALLADGFHSISDIISTITVLVAIKISHNPPDEQHPYGHGNAEVIAAKLLGIILLFTGFLLVYNNGKQILFQQYLPISLIAFWVAIASILLKELMFQYTYRIGEKTNNQAIMADAWHHRSDAISSIAAAIGIMGSYLAYPVLDPIAGLIVALMVIKVGLDVTKKAVISLMNTAPPKEKLKKLQKIALKVPGVEEVTELKTHYNGIALYIDMKILVDYRISVLEGHQIASQVKKDIFSLAPEVKEVLIHVNPMLPVNKEEK